MPGSPDLVWCQPGLGLHFWRNVSISSPQAEPEAVLGLKVLNVLNAFFKVECFAFAVHRQMRESLVEVDLDAKRYLNRKFVLRLV